MLREELSIAEVCRRCGVSRPTAYKYLRQYRADGRKGLVDRKRGPSKSGRRARKWIARLLRQRARNPTWGGRKLLWQLRRLYPWQRLPSERTLDRWLRKQGLSRRRTHKRHAHGVKGTWTMPGRPNDVWTVDFKGWFRTTRGQRIEPLTVRDLHSRYLLAVEPLSGTGLNPVRRVFQRLFARYGLPRAIRSDRGSPFCGNGPHGLTQLSLWWRRLGIRVEFVNRKERQDNNAHEQMHRVLQAEVATAPERTMRAQVRALRRWQRAYNQSRPHEALGLNTPASRYRRSQRSIRKLRWPRYPRSWLVRTVRTAGDIHVNYRTYGIGRAFQRLPVGLKPLGDGKYKVYFERLLIGELNLDSDRSLRRLRSKP